MRSTLNRRVDLPSGGYLIFDYAEAFTVIDVNTGRFVGSRGRSSGARLEDTITKNNLEAVSEVVRQLRLRDIGGIIVIDFIDMANPKNRKLVEEALEQELARDRTKTYVVEISPLGLVEMTRQNVTDGPREILTNVCAACKGDGVVVSMETHAVDAERRIRRLVAGSRSKAFHIELNSQVAATLIGPGAERLAELEKETGRSLAVKGRQRAAHDHFVVLERGLAGHGRGQGAPRRARAGARGRARGGASAFRHGRDRAYGRLRRHRQGRRKPGRRDRADQDRERHEDDRPRRHRRGRERRTATIRRRRSRRRRRGAGPAAAAAARRRPRLSPRPTRPLSPRRSARRMSPPLRRHAPRLASENGEEPKPKKKTRRGTRGGRGRKRKPVESPPEAGQESPLA